MINWVETTSRFGIKNGDKIPRKQVVVLCCDCCGFEALQTCHYHYRALRRSGHYFCRKCSIKFAKENGVYSIAAKKNWQKSEYYYKQKLRKHGEGLKEQARKRALSLWKDTEYVIKYKNNFNPTIARMNLNKCRHLGVMAAADSLKKKWINKEYRDNISKQSSSLWNNKEYRDKVITSLKKYYSSMDVLQKCSEKSKKLFQDEDFKEKWLEIFLCCFTEEKRSEISRISKANWLDPNFRNKIISKWDDKKRREISEICSNWWTDEQKLLCSERMIEFWSDIEYRDRLVVAFKKSWTTERTQKAKEWWTPERREDASKRSTALWLTEEYIVKMKAMMKVPSSLEIQFAEILKEFKIEFETQVPLGPYLFDFKIGNILIEIQGDYWHSLPRAVIRDKAKSSYIINNFPDLELRYLWEREFYELDKIRSFIEINFKNDKRIFDFDFENLVFSKIDYQKAKPLFEKYHYKGSIGRSGYIFGAELNGTLICACVITNPTRNVEGGELTRMVIHPLYQKKNLGSWFLSRAMKLAVDEFGFLFTFADQNFNHDGALYLACGWKFVGETKPDYWYVSENGWIMHKKTLWNRAVSLGLSESLFAESFGYKKVWGLPKKKFEFRFSPK
jgi:GNAT superfamily N-acetyltransferase